MRRQLVLFGLWGLWLGSPPPIWGFAPQQTPAPPTTAPSIPDGEVPPAGWVRLTVDPSSPPFPSGLEGVVSEREGVIARVVTLLGDAAPADTTIELRLYGSAESKALATQNDAWAHLDPLDQTLHVVMDREIRGDHMGLEASALFRRALGPPSIDILETGVAAFHSTNWGRRGLEYWAARLHRAGLIPPIATILSDGWSADESPFIVEPTAGVLVAHLLDRWSRTGFVDRYSWWQPDADEIAALETGWDYHLDQVLRRHQGEIERDLTAARSRRSTSLPQLRGVNYAHEGYRTYDGYLSQRSEESLARLAELGANAVAVLPYAFMSDPGTPEPLTPPTRAGSETDEAVIQAVLAADRQGFTVLLKPHIWLRRSWPGEIEMRNGRDWDRFFSHYERWILHYAILAEIHQVPVLSIGTELTSATLRQEERWERLARKVRGIYSGALVYAANWGEEFESLTFWEVFDYLGIDAYYPLSDDPDASDQELRQGADAMLDRIASVQRRYGKPVLFTEIGFASARGAWVRPWEGNRISEASGVDQLRSYRAVISAMEGRRWIGGVFWWEWPSDLGRAIRDPRGFMPTGKPAETLLKDWFSGLTPVAAF